MNSQRAIFTAVLAAAALFASTAGAETLYKLIDKTGKVTYSEERPKEFDGQVIRIDIDPNANTATLAKPPEPAPVVRKGMPDQPKGITPRGPADAARERLDKARKALAEALDHPAESDYEFLANVEGRGTRKVPTDAYKARVAGLEADVRKAEDSLRRIESAK